MVQGVFSYPGITNPLEGDYTCAHGINPGRATILAPAGNQSPSAVGDLQIIYGNVRITVRDMRLRNVDNVSDERGNLIRFVLEDRRWAWEHQEVYLDDTPTSADIVAKIFLDSMGEVGYDISAVPFEDQEYSSTEPEGRALNGNNPALELQALASKFSLRVVYDPLSDLVCLCRDGVGSNLPNDNTLRTSTGTFEKEPVPSGIRVLGDFVRFQTYLELEAVGVDTDGTIKPIDQLSYKPASGWETTSEYFGRLLDSGGLDTEERQLALDSVFRWYRVKASFSSPLNISVDGLSATVNGRGDIWNLSSVLYEDDNGAGAYDQNGQTVRTTAWVAGEYWPRETNANDSDEINILLNNGDDIVLPYSFTLDSKNKLIKFPFQVFKIDTDSNTGRLKPKLWLYASYNTRVTSPSYSGAKAMAAFSYYLALPADSSRVGADVVREPKIRYWVNEQPSSQPVSQAYGSNLVRDDLLGQSVQVATERAKKYSVQPAAEAVYNSILPVRLDGAIHSVTWSFGDEGASTRVSRNTEPDYILTKHRERVLIGEVRKKVGAVP